MASAWHGEEPELCTESVTVVCEMCGKVVQVDPDDADDDSEYVCLDCTREQ